MIKIQDFISDFPLKAHTEAMPWDIVKRLPQILKEIISNLDNDFVINDGVAIHKSAIIEAGVIIKAPLVVSANCFIGAHAYLRGGVYLAESVVIGPGCEIKTSVIASKSSMAHFNFIGDSVIGSEVNFEAGSITANYQNDKADKRIFSVYRTAVIDTGVDKFGSLVGDQSKIGANAVLSPGTILPRNSIVHRLQLVDQYSR